MVAPPFTMKTADGRWEGLSIEFWQAIAQELGGEYELIEYNTLGQIVEVVEKGELDVILDYPGRRFHGRYHRVACRTEIFLDFEFTPKMK